MRLGISYEVWKRLKETYKSVATAAIDAKPTKLRNIKTLDRESINEYVDHLGNLINELHDGDGGHIKSDL